MHLSPSPEFPPADFVAFLAHSNGLSEEVAELRLASWLAEYQASARQPRTRAGVNSPRTVSFEPAPVSTR